MNSVLYPLCAVGMGLALCYKLYRLRGDLRSAERAALLLTMLFLAVTFTISSPSVWTGLDHLAGWANLSALLSQGSAVLAAASAQVAVLFWSLPEAAARPRARRLIGLTGTALFLMTVLFLVSPQVPERPSDFVAEYAGHPRITEYLVVYLVAFGAIQLSVTVHCFLIAKHVAATWRDGEKFWLRTGFLVSAVGCALGVVYCGLRTAGIVAVHLDIDPHAWEDFVRSTVGIALVLVAIGFTLPSWGPRLSALSRWPRNRRIYRDLYPLWRALYEAVPGIALDPPRTTSIDGPAVRDLDFRVLRRVIEIMDGRLALLPQMHEDAETHARQEALAAGLTGDELDAAVEAHRIRTALLVRSDDSAVPATRSATAGVHPEGGDLSEEIEWFRRVARAFGEEDHRHEVGARFIS